MLSFEFQDNFKDDFSSSFVIHDFSCSCLKRQNKVVLKVAFKNFRIQYWLLLSLKMGGRGSILPGLEKSKIDFASHFLTSLYWFIRISRGKMRTIWPTVVNLPFGLVRILYDNSYPDITFDISISARHLAPAVSGHSLPVSSPAPTLRHAVTLLSRSVTYIVTFLWKLEFYSSVCQSPIWCLNILNKPLVFV